MKAVIFDFDGTLADTVGDIAAAGNHVLAARGLPTHDEAAYRRMVGDGASVLIQRMVPADRTELVTQLLADFREYYPRHMFDHSRAYPGIDELLASLATAQVPLAVLSNKPEAMTRAMAEGLFAEVPFRFVWGQLPERPKKPDPAAAIELARLLAVPASRCAFVGDTPVDMQTASAAGMMPIGVAWGFRPRVELAAAGAHVVLRCPAELLAILGLPAQPTVDLE